MTYKVTLKMTVSPIDWDRILFLIKCSMEKLIGRNGIRFFEILSVEKEA